MKTSDYPECEKLAKVSETSQKIGEFLEWLNEQGFTICRLGEDNSDLFYPDYTSINQRLADFFGIDLNKVEAERRQMLETLRSQNDAT
jgi:hypothetical protein